MRYVIIGGGQAGAQAAESLRAHAIDGSVTMICEESEPPYIRPPLSKAYLQGTVPRESVFIHDAQWYQAHAIDLMLGTKAASIRAASRDVVLAGGGRVPFDRLLIATGSSARRLEIPGAELDGVHSLRSLGDCERIKQVLVDGQHVVLIGGGWIGLEIAAAARLAGLDVTVLEAGVHPLAHVLGDELGEVFEDLHVQHGVRVFTGVTAQSLLGRSGKVTGVVDSDGREHPADAVIIGIGASPNVGVAEASSIAVNNGIVVDEFMRTEVDDVFAAGDVANAYHPRYARHLRVEHWDNARHQADAAADSMLGHDHAYTRLPFFYSDQYDLGLEYTGYAPSGSYDNIVLRGDVDAFEFIAFWLQGHRVIAAMNVNVWDVRPQLGALIESDLAVDPRLLADANTELPVPVHA